MVGLLIDLDHIPTASFAVLLKSDTPLRLPTWDRLTLRPGVYSGDDRMTLLVLAVAAAT